MIINVKTSTNNYDVIILKDSLKDAHKYMNLNKKVLIITDSGVPLKYVDTLKRQCLNPFVYTILQGESSKNINNYQKIIEFMIENNFTRKDVVLALGGGVVGDLSGFVAATFMRGITFYNIPTTLLSQVDSSIGGKTAIDFDNIKNIVGAFYPPQKVIIDPNVLVTLDKRQLHSGLVEALKMGATSDKELFDLIKQSTNLMDDIDQIIIKAINVKKQVVEIDPNEKGLRKILNFGHTVGHAIESSGKFNELLHGECVGIGMLYFSSKEVKDEINQILQKYNLPSTCNIAKNELLNYMLLDKKRSNDYLSIIHVDKVGSFEIKQLSIDEVKQYL